MLRLYENNKKYTELIDHDAEFRELMTIYESQVDVRGVLTLLNLWHRRNICFKKFEVFGDYEEMISFEWVQTLFIKYFVSINFKSRSELEMLKFFFEHLLVIFKTDYEWKPLNKTYKDPNDVKTKIIQLCNDALLSIAKAESYLNFNLIPDFYKAFGSLFCLTAQELEEITGTAAAPSTVIPPAAIPPAVVSGAGVSGKNSNNNNIQNPLVDVSEILEEVHALNKKHKSEQEDRELALKMQEDYIKAHQALMSNAANNPSVSNNNNNVESNTNQPAAAASNDDDSACIVCMDKAREYVFVPCGHLVACNDCRGQLKECPICKVGKTMMRLYK